jgi:hypothetical protein
MLEFLALFVLSAVIVIATAALCVFVHFCFELSDRVSPRVGIPVLMFGMTLLLASLLFMLERVAS